MQIFYEILRQVRQFRFFILDVFCRLLGDEPIEVLFLKRVDIEDSEIADLANRWETIFKNIGIKLISIKRIMMAKDSLTYLLRESCIMNSIKFPKGTLLRFDNTGKLVWCLLGGSIVCDNIKMYKADQISFVI